MSKTFETIEEVKEAVWGAIVVSIGDPMLVETEEQAEEVAHDFLEYTDGTMREVLPNEDAWGMGNDFERAKESLGLKKVSHIYTWSEDGVENLIAFSEDWDHND